MSSVISPPVPQPTVPTVSAGPSRVGGPAGTGRSKGRSTGSSAEHAGDDLSSALRVVVARLGRRLRVERPAEVLPAGMVAVLGTLRGSGPVRISALAETENVRPPSMTRTVSCLQDQGLVARTANPDDGRQVLVSITERGTTALEEDRRRRQAWFDDHLRALTPAERETLRAALPVLQRIAGA